LRRALVGGPPADPSDAVSALWEGFDDLARGDVAAARGRVAHGPPVGSSEGAVVHRLLARAIPAEGGGSTLDIGADGLWFARGGPRVDLSHRGPMRRILVGLARRREASPGGGLSPVEVFELGWPGQRAQPEAANGRVYAAVKGLRGLGLDGILITRDSGYLLDPEVGLRWSD
jgi:hypothetical protein